MSISDEICDSHGLYVFCIWPANLTDPNPVVGHDHTPLTAGYYYAVTEGEVTGPLSFLTNPVGPYLLRKQALAAMLADIIDV